MIAAGIRDYTARPFFGAKRCNLVVCPTQLEGADGLKILRLEIQSAAIVLERQQGCTDDDSVQPGARFVDVGKGDDGCASKWGGEHVPLENRWNPRRPPGTAQISNITGMISGRFWVCLEIY